LTGLDCPDCGQSHPPDHLYTYCQACRSPLLARYDLEAVRRTASPSIIAHRRRGLWRWAELLPVRQPQHRLSLGEGDTPVLALPRLGSMLDLPNLFVKDESVQATGSFKARGLAVAVSRAVELGVREFSIPTAGNAGSALAAYAAYASGAYAGVQAHIFAPRDTPTPILAEIRSHGADLRLVDGLISDAARQALEAAATAAAIDETAVWFDVSTFKEPYRVEGKKTMGFELAEAFGGHPGSLDLPDVILYPTGGGTGLVGMWKAFDELEALGWIRSGRRPRMVSVQAAGCAPVVRAFQAGARRIDPWPKAHTLAAGLRVPAPFADRLIMEVLYASHGTALAVSDDEIMAAQAELARCEGILAAPEGAATLAALRRLLPTGWIKPGEKIVLFNTGAGLKYIS